MKRSLIAALLAAFAVTAVAATQSSSEQYRNDAGSQDQHQPQVGDASDAYHNNAGEQDQHQPQVA